MGNMNYSYKLVDSHENWAAPKPGAGGPRFSKSTIYVTKYNANKKYIYDPKKQI